MFCRGCNLILQSTEHRAKHFQLESCKPSRDILEQILGIKKPRETRDNEVRSIKTRDTKAQKNRSWDIETRENATQDYIPRKAPKRKSSEPEQFHFPEKKQSRIPIRSQPPPKQSEPELIIISSDSDDEYIPTAEVVYDSNIATNIKAEKDVESTKKTSVHGPTSTTFYSDVVFKKMPGYTKGNWPPLNREDPSNKVIFNAYKETETINDWSLSNSTGPVRICFGFACSFLCSF